MFYRFIGLLFLLAILSGAGYLIYELGRPLWGPQESDRPPSASETVRFASSDGDENPHEWLIFGVYPFNRALTDSTGRTAEFTVFARTVDRIYANRLDTQQEHTIYIDTLSKLDRAYMLQVSGSSSDKTSVQLRRIQSEIEALRQRLAVVRSQVQVSGQ